MPTLLARPGAEGELLNGEPRFQTASEPPRLQYVPQLDGFRAVAVALVIFHHALTTFYECAKFPKLLAAATYGNLGVGMFFVLSGYLITTILLRSEGGHSALGHFYFRRVVRIWPLYGLLLSIECVEASLRHTNYPWGRCILLLQNYLPAWLSQDDFNQTWSLCVEEHFYLIWPLLVLYLPRKFLVYIPAALVAASPALRLWALTSGATTKELYTVTQYRLDGISMGCLLALLTAAHTIDPVRKRKIAWLLVAIFGPLAICFPNSSRAGGIASSMFAESFSSLMFTGVLCLLLESKHFAAVLSIRPLRWIGRVSYGLYLIHPFVFLAISRHKGGLEGICAGLILSLIFAGLSFKFIETPALRLGRRSPAAAK